MAIQSSDRLRIFSYVVAENAALYRSIMRVFMDAKEDFRIHLRPQEVLAALDGEPLNRSASDPLKAVRDALSALYAWGNLHEDTDASDVATVEEFYQPRFLYQLTDDGEAGERALAFYEREIRQPGELQAAALDDIRVLLSELRQLIAEPTLDSSKAHRALRALCDRFGELTTKAQSFIGSLQRTIDLRGASIPDFLAYKELLVGYLERFIGELIIATADIASILEELAPTAVAGLLDAVAARELADAMDPSPAARAEARERWHRRWNGLREWFLSSSGAPSQAEVLRARARSAIPALLSAAAAIHERRQARSDRASDLRTLARWFAELESDEDAHRLFRAAFGLAPCRHLSVDSESLRQREAKPVSAQTSWLRAAPIVISPRLRASGHYVRRGRINNVIDRTAEKAQLAQLAQREAAEIEAASRQLATGRRVRLSDLGELEPLSFALFLDLLGEALSRKAHAHETVETTSADGSLRIVLAPTNDDRGAVIHTSHGRFSGPDHYVTISHAYDDELPLLREVTR
ncbi:MAG TPA: TIGR02677 family protein [Polyangia bacterium]|jgi:uncharacterized protein (TIGR02677 family)|nr:TIGR02677 family protein [Polyangia bacterium]